MSRPKYFNIIEEKINILAVRIESRGRLNVLDLNLHGENFYSGLINILYGWKTSNANENDPNVEGIDLIDHSNKIILQVSATATRRKIESSLNKSIVADHKSYTFKFVSIARDADALRNKVFANPHGCFFVPSDDIIDKNWIFKKLQHAPIETIEAAYDLVIRELGKPTNDLRRNSTIAELINFLYEHRPTNSSLPVTITSFDIDRKIEHNNLRYAKDVIEDLSTYHADIGELYSICDQEGVNKSRGVIHQISRFYRDEMSDTASSDDVFDKVVDRIASFAKESGNFVETTEEELKLSSEILTVDTFLRCKIFENPPKDASTQ